jgi:hypothetical protein
MAKSQNDSMLDAAFVWVRDRVTQITVCSTQPTTYAQAITTYKLADGTLTSSQMTISDGDTSGRKVRISSRTGLTVDTTGTAAHVALVGSTGSTLLLVTTCTTQALTTGNTVNIPAWDDEILDAA